jgi:SSS family solute:Na+ symporter
MADINMVSVGIIVVYMVALGAIGWFSRNKVKSCADWCVGSFKIGGIVMGVAFFATYFSAVIMVGFAGLSSKLGLSTLVIGLWHPVATLIAFGLLAPLLAKMFKELKALTFSEFFTLRFKSQTLGTITSLVIAIFIFPYTISAFIAMGSALSALVGTPFWVGVLASGIIVAIYIFSGGLFSATLAEFFQGIVMVIAVIGVAIVSYTMLGGVLPAHEALADLGINFVSFPAFGSPTWVTIIGLTAVMSFGIIAQPQAVLRYATIANKLNIKKAMIIAVLGTLIFPLAAYSYGSLSNPILRSLGYNPATMAQDVIIPTFVNVALPPWLGALFLVGMLCAATSTIDALVHMTAGTVTRDIVTPIFKRDMTDKSQLRLMQVMSLVFAIGACIVAIYPQQTIVQLASYAWTVVSSAFFGPLLVAIFCRRADWKSALGGLVVGFSVAQLWYLYPPIALHAFFPGVGASILTSFVLSRFGKPPQDIVERLFKPS